MEYREQSLSGSSPRLWGVLWCGHVFMCDVTVHPHACGEYQKLIFQAYFPTGSSPRLWGVWYEIRMIVLRPRFIPTPVGSIVQYIPSCVARSVHPHACGEYPPGIPLHRHPRGSSPRLWGVSLDNPRTQNVFRFIPTPVGSIEHVPRLCGFHSVHPHACGEYRRTISAIVW